jgi:transposase-like protein
VAIRTWQNNWEDLATFFAYPAEFRRLIYTTNSFEGDHRQLRKVTKAKSIIPTPESARKFLFHDTRDIINKRTKPIQHWPLILNLLVIRYEGRLAI